MCNVKLHYPLTTLEKASDTEKKSEQFLEEDLWREHAINTNFSFLSGYQITKLYKLARHWWPYRFFRKYLSYGFPISYLLIGQHAEINRTKNAKNYKQERHMLTTQNRSEQIMEIKRKDSWNTWKGIVICTSMLLKIVVLLVAVALVYPIE